MKVLVTGASGFLGGPVCRALAAAGHEVLGAVRRPVDLAAGVRPVAAADLSADADWSVALTGCEAVVHLAARAHVMHETEADPLAVFRRVNRDGTARLAEQAAAVGVRRFIFVSSIKAQGESGLLRAIDAPAPVDPYGVAKFEAEQALSAAAARVGMETTVIRPPLVHGAGAKGNLATLMRVLSKGIPLPLAWVDNRRSLVGADNLADLIRVCLDHPAAAGATFLVRDAEDLSTPQLLRRLAAAMGRRAVLLPVPPSALRLAARMVGRQAMAERLLGSLTVDDAATRQALSWEPPNSVDSGLAAMAAAFR
ncbi:NAD-dependent epimerase/dehydratase family protein [Magnetospirillum aberrantis]|uniref:NAD-dependent epimerase/dehydratase family protein n=1 Tax=Magnetospirillum aberrantis SpK TaxID=908842 RepID=A0A7C9QR24_9PROT|nr:NAD-dependent epimerase/dehydratase family protein [Magnetospirillum aberrantis]NFV78538.1 NAD-dependent epimerase/dehydratase family protein [Magnetospirillum aberrantis SpK]